MKWLKLKKNESGAVTVDWVVLTAAIVGLGVAIIAIIWDSPATLAGKIALFVDGVTTN